MTPVLFDSRFFFKLSRILTSPFPYKVVQIWPGLIFFVTIIDKHLLAHVSLQRTPLTRAGGRVEIVTSFSQGRTAAAQCGLFTHKSVPGIFEPPCIFS